MIKVNKIEETKVEFFHSGKSLGFLSRIEAIDLRIQIAEQKAEGFYFVYEGNRYGISEYGEYVDFPDKLWRDTLEMSLKLRKIQRKIEENDNSN
jgi:hypothetical protein